VTLSSLSILKVDALYAAAALVALALTTTMTVRADGTDPAAPAPAVADKLPALTAVSPAAGTKAGTPGVEPSQVWDLGPHGAGDTDQPKTGNVDQEGSETPHSGAPHSAD
jgi:hypothetical protein